MISVLNFKPYDKGSLKGFFDLRYHGLAIKGCRLMNGNGGLWFALPQKEGQQDGERKWFDIMYLTGPEMDHVCKLVIADLQSQGLIDAPTRKQQHTQQAGKRHPSHRSLVSEDLTAIYAPADDPHGDIPF